MPISEAKKRSNAKWDAANMIKVGCKLRRDKADAFKTACADAGTTANAVLQSAVDAFLRDHGIDPDSFSRKKP